MARTPKKQKSSVRQLKGDDDDSDVARSNRYIRSRTAKTRIIGAATSPRKAKKGQAPSSSGSRNLSATYNDKVLEVVISSPKGSRLVTLKGPAQAIDKDTDLGRTEKESSVSASQTRNQQTADMQPLNQNHTTAPLGTDPLPFGDCIADRCPESSIFNQLSTLNESIESLINIVLGKASDGARHFNKKRMPGAEQPNRTPIPNGPIGEVYKALQKEPLSKTKKIGLMEAILHDKLCALIYERYFDGGSFFGLSAQEMAGPDFNAMFSYISKKDGWRTAQVWRSITRDAMFATQDPTKGATPNLLVITPGIMTELLKLLATAPRIPHPDLVGIINKVVADLDVRQRISAIVRQAEELSVGMQRDMLSSQLSVTLAPTSHEQAGEYAPFDKKSCEEWIKDSGREGGTVLGTYTFGLVRKSLETDESNILLKPKVIVQQLLKLQFGKG